MNKITKEYADIIVSQLLQKEYVFFIDVKQSMIEVDISSTKIVSIELPTKEIIVDGIQQGFGQVKCFDWNGNCILKHTSPALAFRDFHKWAQNQTA